MSKNPHMTIMVVEDSRITRMMEIKVLRELGFENIIQAEDGESAIGKLQDGEEIHLIISDWNMPNMDGYELLVWIRSEEEFREIPFIMATAQASKAQITKAKEAGVNNFISKPFAPPELKEIIEKTFKEIEDGTDITVYEDKLPEITKSGKVLLKMAHIQITDHLALGVLDFLIKNQTFQPKYFELETRCMSSWNPVQNTLEKSEVDGAFILAPIGMDLFGFGVPIKLILFAHKNGSICVRNIKGATQDTLAEFYKDKIFYLPHILSIHHMLSDIMLKELGLKPGLSGHEKINVYMEIIPPVEMPRFLANSTEVAGYMVAEPLGSKGISAGNANLMLLSGEMWNNHPCCVLAMRNIVIDNYPEAVQEFVSMLVQAGKFIAQKPDIASQIALNFLDPHKKLGLKQPVLEKVLKEPRGIKTDNLFPVIEDLEIIQRYMSEELKVSNLIDLNQFVDTRFAEAACGPSALNQRHYSVPDLIKNASKIIVKREAEYLQRDYEIIAKINKDDSLSVKDNDILEIGQDVDCVSHICRLRQINDNNKIIANLWKSSNGLYCYASYSEAYANQDRAELTDYITKNLNQNYSKSGFENNIFKKLERKIKSKTKTKKKISGIFIDINLEKQKVSLVSTDHPPIIFIRNNYPTPRSIHAKNSKLPNINDGRSGSVEFQIFPGSKLFIHSDGLTDVRPQNNSTTNKKFLYPDGLDDFISNHREKTLSDMHSCIWMDIFDFCGEQFNNDLFLLTIEIPNN